MISSHYEDKSATKGWDHESLLKMLKIYILALVATSYNILDEYNGRK